MLSIIKFKTSDFKQIRIMQRMYIAITILYQISGILIFNTINLLLYYIVYLLIKYNTHNFIQYVEKYYINAYCIYNYNYNIPNIVFFYMILFIIQRDPPRMNIIVKSLFSSLRPHVRVYYNNLFGMNTFLNITVLIQVPIMHK